MQDLINRRDSLLERSKIEKSGALIPVICGSASLLGGIIVLNKVDYSDLGDLGKACGGTVLVLVGVGVATIGIVQLIHANKNFKRPINSI